MPYYVDTRLIVNTDYLIEAHSLNGQADYDGWYLIVCTIKHSEQLKETSAIYKTEEERDKAFILLGALMQGKTSEKL